MKPLDVWQMIPMKWKQKPFIKKKKQKVSEPLGFSLLNVLPLVLMAFWSTPSRI